MRISDWSSDVCSSDLRLVVIVVATLGTAAAVSVSGLIAFVGIIVPHTVRLLAGRSHRVVLPLSALFGGAFLCLADLLARTISSPAEIPIGVVTAFFGAPFFVLVLRSARRRSEEHTSELQSLMRISYAVFCLNKKTKTKHNK